MERAGCDFEAVAGAEFALARSGREDIAALKNEATGGKIMRVLRAGAARLPDHQRGLAAAALGEFRAIDSARDTPTLTRAASKINENLYASTALERGTLKIKSMQITWLPIQGPEQKAAKAKALEYMSAILRAFTPSLTKAQSQQKLQKLLTSGKNKRYYAETEGAIRYVVADNGEKGLTFAVEPIKLALSDALGGAN